MDDEGRFSNVTKPRCVLVNILSLRCTLTFTRALRPVGVINSSRSRKVGPCTKGIHMRSVREVLLYNPFNTRDGQALLIKHFTSTQSILCLHACVLIGNKGTSLLSQNLISESFPPFVSLYNDNGTYRLYFLCNHIKRPTILNRLHM